jgi:integrase
MPSSLICGATIGSWLNSSMVAGCGSCLRLRIKDLDFSYGQISVRDGKGMRERITLLPTPLQRPLREHLQGVKEIHQRDLARGAGAVYLPFALQRKCPKAARHWRWQWVFPAAKPSVDPRSGETRRHHVHEKNLQNAVKQAIYAAGVAKAASCHTFAIVLPITFWKPVMIFAPSKSCSDTAMFPPP